MSKELINEIESKIAWNDMNINETSISLGDVKRLLNELDEQAERVEELGEENDELVERVHKLALDWSELVDENNELAERVGELEKEKDEWKYTAQCYYMTNQELREQNKRYREALKFYADRNHYSDRLYDYKIVLLDDGETARKALEG